MGLRRTNSVNKEKLLGQLQIVRDMTEVEGVKQICYVLEELIQNLDKNEIGFKGDDQ